MLAVDRHTERVAGAYDEPLGRVRSRRGPRARSSRCRHWPSRRTRCAYAAQHADPNATKSVVSAILEPRPHAQPTMKVTTPRPRWQSPRRRGRRKVPRGVPPGGRCRPNRPRTRESMFHPPGRRSLADTDTVTPSPCSRSVARLARCQARRDGLIAGRRARVGTRSCIDRTLGASAKPRKTPNFEWAG